MNRILLAILLLSTGLLTAQESEWGINFNGFVKTDANFDTRESVTIREGHFLLYPTPEKLDPKGNDINAHPQFNILSIQTRLTGKITAPDFLGAKTSGVLEGAFFGHSDSDINGFRLRHAFLNLDWGNSELIIGQYWHPMFVLEAFPQVVSFNTGVPFQPFARNPQIKFTQHFNKVRFALSAATQRDFASIGPNPADYSSSVTNSIFLRNAVVPMMHGELSYIGGGFRAGVIGGMKMLKPRLTDQAGNEVDEMISSIQGLGFVSIKGEDYLISAQGMYSQNATDLTTIGGFAYLSNDNGEWEYTNYNTMTAVLDCEYGKTFKVGLMGGFLQNLGTDDDLTLTTVGENSSITGPVWGRGTNIMNVIRISPRFVYQSGKVRLASEFEWTKAAYGVGGTVDSKGIYDETTDVSNLRILLSAYLFF